MPPQAPLKIAYDDVYHILPVNSRSYYKFQVELGATNQDFNIVKHKFMVFNLELYNNYPSVATI